VNEVTLMDPMSTSITFHENSIVELRLVPGEGRLEIVMERPIEGSDGHKMVIFHGVRGLNLTGSITGGPRRYLPGDEVLDIYFEQVQAPEEGKTLVRAEVMINPWLPFPQTGLSVIEILAERVEFG